MYCNSLHYIGLLFQEIIQRSEMKVVLESFLKFLQTGIYKGWPQGTSLPFVHCSVKAFFDGCIESRNFVHKL